MGKLVLAGLLVAIGVGAGSWGASVAAGQASPGMLCPWELDGVNGTQVRFGDATATYWRENYRVADDTKTVLWLTGEYPHARYFSLYVYSHDGRLLDGLFDQQIGPDAGSANPFLPGAARDQTPRRFTLRLRFDERPDSPEPNTVYLNQPRGRRLKGAIVYRIYFPDQGRDAQGGVSAPQLFAQKENGQPTDCPDEPGSPNQRPTNFTNLPIKDPLAWRRFIVNAGIANPDVSYLAARMSLGQHGPLLVIRFQRPTFPDTFRGQVIRNDRDLRFLSLSLATPGGSTLVSQPDSLLPVDPGNRTTIVISKLRDKPSDAALAREDAVWLDVGSIGNGTGVLLYRNTLENPAFPHAIGRVPPDANAPEVEAVMGAYYPAGSYCRLEAFQADGCRSAP